MHFGGQKVIGIAEREDFSSGSRENNNNTEPLTSLHLFVIFGHVIWPNASQKLDVLITVKFGHLFLRGFVWTLQADHGKNPLTD